MADETTRVDEWLQGILVGDAALVALTVGIYEDSVPQGSAFPAVIHQVQGVADVRTATNSGRIMISGVWLVKAVDETETYQGVLKQAADRIDALLEQSGGGAAGADGVVFTSVREAPFRLAEIDQGINYRHLGGLYRVFAQVP